MKFHKMPLADVLLVDLKHHIDQRGDFVKIYHRDSFLAQGIEVSFVEDFYSRSHQGVLRGMHFQHPPHALWKLVTCLEGKVLDVGFDMRRGSPTFGQWFDFILSSDVPQAILLPPGIAHGFLTIAEKSLVLYKCSAIQHVESEGGILWNSFGYRWPVEAPTISPRDLSLPSWDILRHSSLDGYHGREGRL